MLCLDEKVEKINLFWYGKHQNKKKSVYSIDISKYINV